MLIKFNLQLTILSSYTETSTEGAQNGYHELQCRLLIAASLTVSLFPIFQASNVCRICWHPCSIRWRRISTLWRPIHLFGNRWFKIVLAAREKWGGSPSCMNFMRWIKSNGTSSNKTFKKDVSRYGRRLEYGKKWESQWCGDQKPALQLMVAFWAPSVEVSV